MSVLLLRIAKPSMQLWEFIYLILRVMRNMPIPTTRDCFQREIELFDLSLNTNHNEITLPYLVSQYCYALLGLTRMENISKYSYTI